MTRTLTVTFTVAPDTDAHLQTAQAIKDEIAAWLQSLGAEVVVVHVEGEQA